MILLFRPIDAWPGELRSDSARQVSPFSAHWPSTLEVLGREVEALGADEVIIQLAVPPNAVRLDGTLRQDRRPPEHPGVILSIDTRRHGPLRYWTDRFTQRWGRPAGDAWRENVRAIALGMEAQRKIERYGIADRGEQYVGWKAIGSGIALGPSSMTVETAAKILCDATADEIGEDPADIERVIGVAESLYREAAKHHHPDVGGDPAVFRTITEARDLLVAQRR